MTQPNRSDPQPTLSVFDAVTIMVGIVVGIGIFKTPSLIAANVGSEMAFLGVWVAGGIVTLIGALCYAELAAAHPHAGGEYHFLGRAYGRSVAVLFGWARGSVIQTGAIAAVAFVLGDYAAQVAPLGPYGSALYAALAIIVLTGLNVAGTVQSKTLQIAVTFIEVGLIAAIIGWGLFGSAGAAAPAVAATPNTGALGLAMIFVLLTYGGWNEAAYLSGELRDPGRNMVRVLVIGTAVLIALYVAANAALLAILGLEGLRGSQAVATDMMRLVAGESDALIVSLAIVAVLATWLWRAQSRVLSVALGLVIGGALSNVLDRVRHGAVTDFLDFHFATYHWPAFNLADMAIVAGAALLLLDGLHGQKREAAAQ